MDKSVITVKSLFHEYVVDFGGNVVANVETLMKENNVHFIVDSKVYELYKDKLKFLENGISLIKIDALEKNKDIETVQKIMLALLRNGISKNDVLIAIGGGIIQDVSALTAHILMRGIRWFFVPTTLLSMCDSCIGSKCGVNMVGFKNQIGAFCPPHKVVIDIEFLKSLDNIDILSGIGEIVKVHLISGEDDFSSVKNDYGRLITDTYVLRRYVFRSLEIKKIIAEIDEFDTGYRHILNYGHTFGYALEAYTDNFIPHGIGVTLGMEIANFISVEMGYMSKNVFVSISELLRRNIPYDVLDFSDRDKMSVILTRDKKYDGQRLGVILSKGAGRIFEEKVDIDDSLLALIASYARHYRPIFGDAICI